MREIVQFRSDKIGRKYPKQRRNRLCVVAEYTDDIKEPENLDGSSRQLKGEIIQNEHEILNTLLNQEGTDELSDFDEDDAVLLQEQDENIPLPNQNFSNISGQIKSISDDQEYCAACKKPVETEWKACPFCGEFLEEYED